MAFEVENLTEQDRLRYNTDPEMMDLSKIPLKRWITDKERDISIWGGMASSHWMAMAEGDSRWRINLRYQQKIFWFLVWPDKGSVKFLENPYIVRWKSIDAAFPKDLHGYSYEQLVEVLKDALTGFSKIEKGKYAEGVVWLLNLVSKHSFVAAARHSRRHFD